MRTLVWLLIVLMLTVALVGCSSEKDRGKNRNYDKPQAADKDK